MLVIKRIRELIGSVGYGALSGARNLIAATIVTVAPVQAETVIAALGDSLTQGYGLVPEDGFVPQLQTWLSEAGADVRLINAGVSGDTTSGGLARIGWTLTDDVDALIVALGGNDVLRGIAPDVARANLDGILQAAEARGLPVLLVGVEAPGNYGPDYKLAFEAAYAELAEAYRAVLYPNFLAAISGDTERALTKWMQADGIHPNAKGVTRIVSDMGPSVLALIERVD